MKNSIPIQRIPTEDYQTPEPRSYYSILDSSELNELGGTEPLTLAKGFEVYV